MFARVMEALLPLVATAGTVCKSPTSGASISAYGVVYWVSCSGWVSTVPPADLYAVRFASMPLSGRTALNLDRLTAPLFTSWLVTTVKPAW